MYSLTRFHICGGCWFHICPIICGKKAEEDMAAAPNVYDIEQILSNPPTPPKTKTIGLDTQKSLVQCQIENTSETISLTDGTLFEHSRKSSVDVGTDTVGKKQLCVKTKNFNFTTKIIFLYSRLFYFCSLSLYDRSWNWHPNKF